MGKLEDYEQHIDDKKFVNIEINGLDGKDLFLKIKLTESSKAVGMPGGISYEDAKKVLILGIAMNATERIRRDRMIESENKSNKQSEKKNEIVKMRFHKLFDLPIISTQVFISCLVFGPNGILVAHDIEHTIPINLAHFEIDLSSIKIEDIMGKSNLDLHQFKQWRNEIDTYIDVLASKGSSQEDVLNAVNRMLRIERLCESYYESDSRFIKEYTEKITEKSSFIDKFINTYENYKTDCVIGIFKAQMGLSSFNISQFEMLQCFINEGFEVTIDKLVLDPIVYYSITGESLESLLMKDPNLTFEQIRVSYDKFLKTLDDELSTSHQA